MIPMIVVGIYLALLLGLGIVCSRFFRGTSADFFVASRSIGPFVLLMSVFGTTMTAFALVGSTGKAYVAGIGTYGLMASWSGLLHSAIFFLIGIKLWAFGKRHGYMTQCEFFRDRFESDKIGYVMFPVLVGLVVPYLLIGIMGSGAVVAGITGPKGPNPGAFPELFEATKGAVPVWLTGLVISVVVLIYVFMGGVRGAAWANTFQTLVFMATGIIAFVMIAKALGGPAAASQAVLDNAPEHAAREGKIGRIHFFSYLFIPLSVGMFPHLFQNWLTARSAKSFRTTVILHPVCIMIVWVPCVLIGIWAIGQGITPPPGKNENTILAVTVGKLLQNPWLTGILTAGILAAIMSSLDSQFMCIGTMFTKDIVVHATGEDRFTDGQKLWIGRGFVIAIVAITYVISLFASGKGIFPLAVWCFSGFGALFPIVFAAVYWKRTTKAGVYAALLVTTGVWFYFFRESGYGGEHLLFTDLFAENTDPKHPTEGIMPVAVMFATCLITLVAVSLATKPPAEATIAKFFPEKR